MPGPKVPATVCIVDLDLRKVPFFEKTKQIKTKQNKTKLANLSLPRQHNSESDSNPNQPVSL